MKHEMKDLHLQPKQPGSLSKNCGQAQGATGGRRPGDGCDGRDLCLGTLVDPHAGPDDYECAREEPGVFVIIVAALASGGVSLQLRELPQPR